MGGGGDAVLRCAAQKGAAKKVDTMRYVAETPIRICSKKGQPKKVKEGWRVGIAMPFRVGPSHIKPPRRTETEGGGRTRQAK